MFVLIFIAIIDTHVGIYHAIDPFTAVQRSF